MNNKTLQLYNCSSSKEKEMSLKETNDFKTKIKLCIVASIAFAVIVAVWGLLLNFFLLYYLQEVSHYILHTGYPCTIIFFYCLNLLRN